MEEIEEFRDIVGYEGLYQISNLGRVKSLERYSERNRLLKEKIFKNHINDNGYFYIELRKMKKIKKYRIHCLLYKTFICDYDIKKYQIDHIDRNRQNNNLNNLRLVSQRGNSNNLSNQSKYGCGVNKKGNKFRTQIQINKKNIYIGAFETQLQAHNKYLSVKTQLEEIEKITHNYTFKRTKIGKEYFIELFPL